MTYTIENNLFRVSANEIGAELSSFADLQNGEYEYLWQKCNIWNGQSPLLFPIVGRLREDTYALNGKYYTLAKHGFARKSLFSVESHTEQEMTFLLRDSDDTLERYPFPFELRVHYYFTSGGFVMGD